MKIRGGSHTMVVVVLHDAYEFRGRYDDQPLPATTKACNPRDLVAMAERVRTAGRTTRSENENLLPDTAGIDVA